MTEREKGEQLAEIHIVKQGQLREEDGDNPFEHPFGTGLEEDRQEGYQVNGTRLGENAQLRHILLPNAI